MTQEQSAAGAKRLPSIMICMPIGTGSLPWPTALSLMKTVVACKAENIPLTVEVVAGCSVVTWARSGLADAFIKSDHTHLFWIDSDIVWSLDDFFRIVGFGAVLDVVGATYPFKTLNPVRFLVNHEGEPGQYQVNGLGCVKIRGMGLGFTLVKRAVIEAIAADKVRRTDPITKQTNVDMFRIDHEGEDLAFFSDIRAKGYDAWLDPSIQLGHYGNLIFRGDPLVALGLENFTKEIKA